MKKFLFLPLIFLAFGIAFAQPPGSMTAEKLHAAMGQYLTCLPLKLVNLQQQEISISNEELCLATIYAATGMKPLWISEHGPNEKAADILHFLKNADYEGLNMNDYNVEKISALWKSRNPEQLAQLDTLLTLGLIKYAHDVRYGRIIPFQVDPELFAEAGDKNFQPVETVRQALAAPDLANHLAGLPPSHKYYRNLRQMLRQFREIAEKVSWEPIDGGRNLRQGDRDERIRQIRNRLTALGEDVPTIEDETLFDRHLTRVIINFQAEYGLENDGIIGKNTLAVLNMTPREKLNTIILNMARWRWHQHEMGRRYILVNIANYDLKAVDEGHEILNMGVIVGQFQHQTPVFSDRIKYIDFNPFWNIPQSIARNEELPELRKDPNYLVDRHVRLLSGWTEDAVEIDSTTIDWNTVSPRQMNRYKLRQDPGPWNALGSVKFVFPNSYDVYLHDTPTQDLFGRSKRTFSHGCIRVSKPLVLAEFILEEQKEEWTMARIHETIASANREIVSLSTPLPVHITYQTAWVDNQRKIRFNNDNYDRDKILAKILFNRDDSEADPN